MAEFRKMILTNKGQNLIAKLINGSSGVRFTRLALSSTAYTDAQIPTLTSITGVKQTADVSRTVKLSTAAVKLEGAVTNDNLNTGYTLNTIAVYAADPDEGEILYSVAGANVAGYVPAYNGVTVSGVYITVTTTVSNADNVDLTVDPAAVATIGDVETLAKRISDLQAFVGYTDSDIYGVEVDFVNKRFTRLAAAVGKTPGADFDGCPAFGGRRRCNLTNDGVVAAYYGDPGFSTTGKLTQAVTLPDESTLPAGTIVQVMVEQPKFYYKVVPILVENRAKGSITRKVRYYVSDKAKAGFKLHPAFICDGKENEKIYLSAFEASLYDASAGAYIMDDSQVADFSADMLASIANAKPISGLTQNLTRANTRKLAQKRGTGWEQGLIQTASASNLLMLVEYAAFNMQKAIGAGVTNKADDGATSMTELTGATVNLGNASGSVTNTNGYNVVSYRGEENLWGNIWTWEDGINANGTEKEVYIADHGFADDTGATPYVAAGFTVDGVGGYVSAWCYSEAFDWLFIAGECLGNDSLPVGDYFWRADGWRVCGLGASWTNGGGSGPFSRALISASSFRNRNIGGRSVYVPSKKAA